MPTITKLAGHRFEQIYDNGVTYLISFECERTLRWEVVAGPEAGQAATELYDSVQIAPNIYFITWLEEGGAVISQVADYNQMIVYTSLACDGNWVLLKGKLN
jgi:phenolic acid decarboxylase